MDATEYGVRWQAVGAMGLLGGAITAFGLAPLAMPDSYSWVELGLSEAAAQGVDGAWVARSGFLLFGFAVLWLVRNRGERWPLPAVVFHCAFGVSMIAVSTFSHRSWDEAASFVASEDRLHSVFASIGGVGFIGGVLCVLIGRSARTVRNSWPDAVALAVALAVPLMMSTTVWGALQRLMFLTAACWYGREALRESAVSLNSASARWG